MDRRRHRVAKLEQLGTFGFGNLHGIHGGLVCRREVRGKLPQAVHTFDLSVDRDTQIGTGSNGHFFCSGGVFTVTIWIAIKNGLVCSVATGYSGADSGSVSSGCGTRCGGGIDTRVLVRSRAISPLAQVIFSERTGDSGAAAAPSNSRLPAHPAFSRLRMSHSSGDILRGCWNSPVYQNFHRLSTGCAGAVQSKPELHVLILMPNHQLE